MFCACLLSTVCCLLVLSGCGKKGDPTLKAYEKPEAPSDLRAIHRESELILLWKFPKARQDTIKGFHVLKASAGDFDNIAFMDKESRSYADTDFVVGQEYHYKIVSESLKGIMNDSPIIILKPQPPPQPPINLSFSILHDMITLSWESTEETSYFNVYRGSHQGEYSLIPVNADPLKNPSFQDSFNVNHTVSYTVRSLTGSAIRDEGPPSEELIVNPLEFTPSKPQELSAVPMDTSVYLIWKEPPETWVTGYKIYRSEKNQEDYVLIGSTSIPSFIDQGSSREKRSYRVTAVGPSKEGSPAEIRDVVYKPSR